MVRPIGFSGAEGADLGGAHGTAAGTDLAVTPIIPVSSIRPDVPSSSRALRDRSLSCLIDGVYWVLLASCCTFRLARFRLSVTSVFAGLHSA